MRCTPGATSKTPGRAHSPRPVCPPPSALVELPPLIGAVSHPRIRRYAAQVGFDIRALIDERRGQAARLHDEHLNPMVPKMLHAIGFDREFVRAEGAHYWDP